MTDPLTLILPDLVHVFDTVSCRATLRIAYVYQPREESDGETPMYPESAEIDSVTCIAIDWLDEEGDVQELVWVGIPLLFQQSLQDAVVTKFQFEVDDDRLEAMCLEDARIRQEP